VPPVRQCAGRPRIARRGVESSERLGRHRPPEPFGSGPFGNGSAGGRWVIEHTLAWFARFRRLTVRHERRLDTLLGFHPLAAALVCLRFVERWSC
jgi:transposase